ncbi:restriction endonuclease subunit S [Ruminococcus flavefaciens]|uniref:Type I restriction enzyme, S subunit n=1 Tax=Ruminococcus flavefaciens TaxID=1265 RepID=A0A1K1NB09_RUMFL|nr:restriction endonuclease subunit S [Ruminococcus flavefaciens]SFW32626.1 type I restriction enzyme, S subunit [Ruminococcus flavefaciens]
MIDTKALRSRILDLAIQGKLTEQLPSDGTAEDLYQQIQAEKQKLIKEKPLPPIKSEEIPFDIPRNWKWVRVKELTSLFNGKAFKPSDWSNNGLPIVRIQNLNNDNAPYNHYDKPIEDEYHLYGGELLFAWSGTPGTSFGAHIWKAKEAVLNQHIFKLVFNENCIYKTFFMYALNHRVSSLFEHVHGSAGLQHVTKGVFENTLIALPPLAEQKRIVERVEEIFRLLDTIDEAQEKYSADSQILKAKLITAGIQGKLTKQLPSDGSAQELYQQIQAEKQKLIKEGKLKKEKPLPPVSPEEVPFEIPENWMWVRLSSLGTFSSGKTPSMAEPAYWDGDIPWVTSKDMKTRIINDSEMHITELGAENMQIYPAGTLLLVVRSGILRRMLPLCVLGVNSTINQDLKAFSLYDLSISPWLYFAIKAFEPYILKNLVKAMTTVESLKFDEFASMLLPLPPLAEQKRIADVLERALGEIDNRQ